MKPCRKGRAPEQNPDEGREDTVEDEPGDGEHEAERDKTTGKGDGLLGDEKFVDDADWKKKEEEKDGHEFRIEDRKVQIENDEVIDDEKQQDVGYRKAGEILFE